MAKHAFPKRRDSKHRVLRVGESVREDGLYQFKYHVNGKAKFIYSWRLEPTDKLPQGKKPCLSLREMEKKIGYDLDSQMDPSDGAGEEIPGNQDRSKAQHAYKLQIRVESSGEGGFQREADRGCKDLRREALPDQDAG